jgi:redox-sensing transcriptional repressor
VAPNKIGQQVAGKEVLDAKELPAMVRSMGIKMAIMAVPPSAAQQVAEMLIESGVEAILNYAPINISVPENVQVQSIDPAAHLQHMTYYLG